MPNLLAAENATEFSDFIRKVFQLPERKECIQCILSRHGAFQGYATAYCALVGLHSDRKVAISMPWMIAYQSRSLIPDHQLDSELRDIATRASIRNSNLAITGVLFYSMDRFFQVLQGEQDALVELMKSIDDDPRHDRIIRRADGPIEKLTFSDWHMKTFFIDGQDLEGNASYDFLKSSYREILKEKDILDHKILAFANACTRVFGKKSLN